MEKQKSGGFIANFILIAEKDLKMLYTENLECSSMEEAMNHIEKYPIKKFGEVLSYRALPGNVRHYTLYKQENGDKYIKYHAYLWASTVMRIKSTTVRFSNTRKDDNLSYSQIGEMVSIGAIPKDQSLKAMATPKDIKDEAEDSIEEYAIEKSYYEAGFKISSETFPTEYKNVSIARDHLLKYKDIILDEIADDSFCELINWKGGLNDASISYIDYHKGGCILKRVDFYLLKFNSKRKR